MISYLLFSCRVYYVSEKIMKLGSNVARENLISLGTCFGSIINNYYNDDNNDYTD